MKTQECQPELFPTADDPPKKQVFRWEFMIRGQVYTGYGSTLREALADVGRAVGLTGMPETVYRNVRRLYKPELVSKTAMRFLEQK